MQLSITAAHQMVGLSLARFELPTIEHPVSISVFRHLIVRVCVHVMRQFHDLVSAP